MLRTTNIQFKRVSAKETYEVRHPVLRHGLPIETCAFERDEDSSTTHFGAYISEKLVGVVSLLHQQSDVQLRGMAVLPSMQGKGIGSQMITKAETHVKAMQISKLWMNARLVAVPFYERCGYQKQGELFKLPYGGDHYKMIKHLCG